mgnify:CR=1 FL=1
MIPNSILTINGKGGVGKTSLVANIAGLTAGSGWRGFGQQPAGHRSELAGSLPSRGRSATGVSDSRSDTS